LPRAVRPQEAEDLPGLHQETDPIHGRQLAEPLDEPADLNDSTHGSPLLSLTRRSASRNSCRLSTSAACLSSGTAPAPSANRPRRFTKRGCKLAEAASVR